MTVQPDTETTPARGKRPKQGEPVVDRALSLLAVFSDRRRALTLSEMARYAGMPAPTALRLIARLVAWGALERLDDGRYVVGVRLWEVASLSPRGHGVREIALPYLEDLFEVTRHHVLLAVRDNEEAVLIERLSSKDATEVAYRVGGRAPLRSTAVGLVLLAGADQQFQEAILRKPPENEPGVPDMPEGQVRRTLSDVRRTGIAMIRRSLPSRTVSVASPVFDAQGSVVAALSIVVPDGSTPPNVLAPAVRATARAVSRNLGHHAEVSPDVRTHSQG
ncbi:MULTISPECIES: IclR family transcriptional regulator [Pseudarthrobacter]|uniref:IclR family transcriptional regulator n=1 Tax=Pseudarthrobacter polychromogenes TaxID=1676 RepID=A0ABQ1XIW3_9MICC|nr:IclR family transcriptional regulator [Pseudarthrobacter polychromogenes]MBD1537846.1 IclR family transcriptional regulator [Arthrobacter sp. S13_S34]GGG94719.1 IclR family transcriptional regulator [Pseudarthrobacter polychromogenes]